MVGFNVPVHVLAINGASAALMISPLPFSGPVGAVRMGMIDSQLVINPTLQETENESTLDLIVVGTKDGLTMVEAGAEEIPEDTLLAALEQAHEEIIKLCEAQEDLARQAGKPKWLDMELTGEIEAPDRTSAVGELRKRAIRVRDRLGVLAERQMRSGAIVERDRPVPVLAQLRHPGRIHPVHILGRRKTVHQQDRIALAFVEVGNLNSAVMKTRHRFIRISRRGIGDGRPQA